MGQVSSISPSGIPSFANQWRVNSLEEGRGRFQQIAPGGGGGALQPINLQILHLTNLPLPENPPLQNPNPRAPTAIQDYALTALSVGTAAIGAVGVSVLAGNIGQWAHLSPANIDNLQGFGFSIGGLVTTFVMGGFFNLLGIFEPPDDQE